MADNKKYYYMKLKENFFESEEMILLETMQDGYLYSNILLKLYLRSLKNEGHLMFKGRIPYSPEALSAVVRHSVGVTKIALETFKNLGLIEVLDNGSIYMLDMQELVGKSNTEADRKKAYRKKIANEKESQKLLGQNSDKCPDVRPPEKEIEKEIDIEIETTTTTTEDKKQNSFGSGGEIITSIIDKLISNNLVQPSGINLTLRDDLEYLIPCFSEPREVIELAIADASRNNAKSWKYVYTILNTWIKDEIKSLEEARKELEKRGQKNNASYTRGESNNTRPGFKESTFGTGWIGRQEL